MKAVVAAGVVILAGCASSGDSGYQAACDAPPAFTIFVDMYHPGHVEQSAVMGFTIVAPDGR